MNDNLSIIVAVGNENAIGRNNELLCHLPNDLKRFKALTSGSTVIMGENTYFSLPVRPLPNRRNIVLTFDRAKQFPNCEIAYSIEQAMEMTRQDAKIFIIGGASVYKQFLPLVSTLYLTFIHADFAGADAFFPTVNFPQWQLLEEIHCKADEKHPHDYSYCTYKRR
ncbi:MAG: dihydrofolate reductase [Lentimicrobiaceae bacterium]|nr:dihydrofolate reductase [Lentimicrobiaceae bacterium]